MELDARFEEKIIALLAQAVPRKYAKTKITRELRLRNDLGIDSLAIASLLFRLEEAFGMQLDEQAALVDLGQLRTVSDAIDLSWRILQRARPRPSQRAASSTSTVTSPARS